ncbi:LysR family transcriptional regulator [Deinococcus altitudinis]|uniref:LysR family transcriptional regulator n=1 Tax=Deinococcus altitudinis TaxID=468914 RepID=UPI0038911F01
MQRNDSGLPRGLELRHLRYFVAVAEELHFGRAARRLNLAQPPLSQQIRQLEELLGGPLLLRNSRSVQLTPAGAAFLGRARRTLRNVHDDVWEVRSISQGARGVLRIGFAGSAILTVLPGLLSRYRTQAPLVDLNLRESFTAQVVDGLLSGSLDAGIVRDTDPVSGLDIRTVSSEPFVAVLPSDHPDAHLAAVPVDVLRGRPFVYYPRSAGTRAFEKPLSLCEAAGFRPVIAQEASQWLTILRLVGAGLGVSLAPASVAEVAPANVVCRPLSKVTLESNLQFVCRTDDRRPLVRSFEALALEH